VWSYLSASLIRPLPSTTRPGGSAPTPTDGNRELLTVIAFSAPPAASATN
jgi:hypothetical protein